MATELVLIRHGHAARVKGDYVHAPLTKLGEKQAALTGQFFCQNEERLDGFYCSPLRRAKETAAVIGSKTGQIPQIQNGIQELEGIEVPQLVVFEVLAHFHYFGRYLYDNVGKQVNWPILGRVTTVLTKLLEKYPDQKIGVVTHSGVISSVLAWFFPGRRRHWWRYTVGNCSLTRLKIEGTRAELIAINDTKHLTVELVTTQPPAGSVETAKVAEQKVEQVIPVIPSGPQAGAGG